MTHKNLKTTLRTFIEEVWNNGNFTQLENFVAAKYELKRDPGDPWDGQTLTIPTFKERVLYSRNAFPDLHFEIQDMIEENEKVGLSWIMSGTHQGDLPQLPATGKAFSISGITIYYFEEGKLCGHRQAFDQLGVLSQVKFFN